MMKVISTHNEYIICPECNTKQLATVEHTKFWNIYFHECVNCWHIILESEWHKVEINIPNK